MCPSITFCSTVDRVLLQCHEIVMSWKFPFVQRLCRHHKVTAHRIHSRVCGDASVRKPTACCLSHESTAQTMMWNTCYAMIRNAYVTGFCVYCTILFIVILKCTFLLSKKKFAVKQWAVLCRQQPYTSHVQQSLVLDLIVFCTVMCCGRAAREQWATPQSQGVQEAARLCLCKSAL